MTQVTPYTCITVLGWGSRRRPLFALQHVMHSISEMLTFEALTDGRRL